MDETDRSQEPLIRRDRDTSGIDLNNTDPKQIHVDMVKVDFEDVIAEPAGIHSLDGVWKCSYHIFTKSKYCCYCSLAAIMGIPLSLVWGLLFAFLSFCHIWTVKPCMKIGYVCLSRPCSRFVHSCCDLLCKTPGKICSGMRKVLRRDV